ncbi:hypothetical protein GOV09_00095 [Candidatus Woesearchaeota archaeon]|nr:hypothetical protein [Candidatus Woesearchaeota archaeon]
METDYLLDKKIEALVDMKVGSLKKDIQEALLQMQGLNQEIDILKNKVQRLNLGAGPQTKLAVESPAVPQEKPKEMNQRTGNLTPEEVSIEKMFYFGNK